jgi:hypothetical protein
MPSVNPGPATTSNANAVAAYVPVNTVTNSNPTLTNGLRLIAEARAMSLAGTGDAANMPIINCGTYIVEFIIVGNAVGGSAAAGNITLNTGPAVTGTQFRAAGVLAGVTGPTTGVAQTVTSGSVINSAQSIYVNVSAAVAGVTVDVFVYGFDTT